MIIDYIHSHQAEFWITVGFLILAVEILLMGLSTIVLMFVGFGALITGLLMLLGLLPDTWTTGVSSLGICSGLSALVLWRPLKKMQGEREPSRDQSSDFIGLEFDCEQDINAQQPGSYRYSGVQWRVELDKEAGVDNIASGTRVVVTSIDVGLFRVKPTAIPENV